MNNTLTVSKGEKKQIIDTVYLQNENIVLSKITKVGNYEIELHRFSKAEIEILQKSIELLYEEISVQRKSSIKCILTRLIK